MSAYTNRLSTLALQQYDRYHLLREQQDPLKTQIRAYWAGIATFPGVTTPWSAVFVSWCVKQAGATAGEFLFAAAHSKFVRRAIQNQVAGTGVFHGHDVANYAPKVGDILQNNRGNGSFDFAHARTHSSYQSHSAIVMEVGSDTAGRYLRTVGGNESDSVGMKEVRCNAHGLVKNPSGLYIAVIETLK